MITINIYDYYGKPSRYADMPLAVFDRLESAYLNGEQTIEVSFAEYALLNPQSAQL